MAHSQSREDYIKFIYMNSDGEIVSNKTIAAGLGVAPPSVSEMITKLADDNLVEYRPYHGCRLKRSGECLAKDLIRKHEIWEFFLQQKLGYSEEESHDLAEVLEHSMSNEFANRLAKYIDFPEM